jgi:hypothetical protein
VHWLIEGEGGKDLAFPFALPHLEFVLRCRAFVDVAKKWVQRPWNAPERRAMGTFRSILGKLEKDQRTAPTLAELRERWRVFGDLRAVLRLEDSELPGGEKRTSRTMIPSAQLLYYQNIEIALKQHEAALRETAGADADKKRPDTAEGIVLKYLERYRGQLFGHTTIRDENGEVTAVVERTNNPLEHFFGRSKQFLRRRLGRANLARDLQQQPAQAALVANFRHPDYVQVVCGSLERIHEAFATLDAREVANVNLTRDHRDSQLDRIVGRLLDRSPPPEGARLPPPTPYLDLHATES